LLGLNAVVKVVTETIEKLMSILLDVTLNHLTIHLELRFESFRPEVLLFTFLEVSEDILEFERYFIIYM
jgi:hypothetical protein